MVKIDTKTILRNFKGEPINSADGEQLTIGDIVINVLSDITSNPSRSWKLGKAFMEPSVDLKAEDVIYLLECIKNASTGGKAWLSSLLAGQMMEILDGTTTKKKATQ